MTKLKCIICKKDVTTKPVMISLSGGLVCSYKCLKSAHNLQNQEQ